jgi:hypothetical protein
MKTAYNFALSDWFKPPVINQIERREGCIRVKATDNSAVARVRVTLLDEQGNTVEKGEGIRGEGDWRKLSSPIPGKTILAEAWDLPGHVTKLVVTPTVPPGVTPPPNTTI